jgi:uncharacterized protein YdiU (UPF0061 family)
MAVGFIHGVMNTDNVALSGETIDYGPCAFMNEYDPATVYSSIDTNGRYAYGNQPAVMQWNLARFAETLLPLIAGSEEVAIETVKSCLKEFPVLYNQEYERLMSKRLGGAVGMLGPLLEWMYRSKADYTDTFATLSRESTDLSDPEFRRWYDQWRSSATEEPENPKVIPRNQIVEEAIRAVVTTGDVALMQELIGILRNPGEWPPERFRASSDPEGYRTFCGT